MAKPSGGADGYYTATLLCTTAAGFASEQAYTIDVAATVDSAPGGIAYDFTVTAAAVGAGPIVLAFTVTNAGGTPLENATVSLRLAGTLRSTGTTDAAGQVSLTVDTAGTYSRSVTCTGYSASTADLAVTASATVATIALTAITVTPSAAGFTTGYWVCYDEVGTLAANVVCSMTLVDGPGTAGFALSTVPRTAISGADGVVQFANLLPGASYDCVRGTREVTRIEVPAAAGTTVALDELLGQP
jgi:hypothetical protein